MLATKSQMVNFCETCAAICCDCDLWEPIAQITKKFLSSKKREKLKPKNITTFGKSLFLTQYWMRYAIYIPPITKKFILNLTMVAYGNRQNAITFARANNSDFFVSTETFNGNQDVGKGVICPDALPGATNNFY